MYGSYIRAARERKGISPAEAARRVGYKTPDMIYKIESDKASASLEMLDKLAEAYDMRIGDLLPNSGASPANDLTAPILAAMVGLDSQVVNELVLNLAEQARIQVAWRRRDEQHGITPSAIPYNAASGIKSTKSDVRGSLVDPAGAPPIDRDNDASKPRGKEQQQADPKHKRSAITRSHRN